MDTCLRYEEDFIRVESELNKATCPPKFKPKEKSYFVESIAGTLLTTLFIAICGAILYKRSVILKHCLHQKVRGNPLALNAEEGIVCEENLVLLKVIITYYSEKMWFIEKNYTTSKYSDL